MANRIKIDNPRNKSLNGSSRNLKDNTETLDESNQVIEMIYQGRASKDINSLSMSLSPFGQVVQEPFVETANSDDEQEVF